MEEMSAILLKILLGLWGFEAGWLSVSLIIAIQKRRYEKMVDEWFANNRVLKVEDVDFIFSYHASWAPLIDCFVCSSKDECCHRLIMEKWVLGKMIIKKKKILRKKYYFLFKKIPKETFITHIMELINIDKEWWSKVDIRLFPEWLVAELVARKLSEV